MKSTISRRNFMKVSAISGGGMLLSFSFLNANANLKQTGENLFSPNAYISLNSDGKVVIMAPNPEIGQGVKTSLPMIIAEELGINWRDVKVEFAPLKDEFGRQSVGGSGSIRGRFNELRIVGATAREMLTTAAAQTWGVPVSECYAENGKIKHSPTGKSLNYGMLASKAAELAIPSSPKLKDPKDFKIIGTRVNDVDASKITSGQALFGIDTRREGMLFAMVSRPPAYGKKLKSVDDAETLKVNGVKKVIKLENSVAVLATSTWSAKKGRDALIIEWEAAEKLESSSAHFASFEKMVMDENVEPARNDGDFETTKSQASKVLDVTYEIPTLSHGQMEPLNFFADVKEHQVELYGPTQVPGSLRAQVSKKLNIPEENIKVATPRQGGGFGRKLMTDNGVEAALISAAAKSPVQVQWTREDDMQNDFYRPAEMYRFQATLSENELLGWYQSGVAIGRGARGNSYVAGALDNYRGIGQGYESNTPIGWWRAPGACTLAYVAESFMDEICVELKKDPVAFRLEIFDKAKVNPVGRLSYDPDKYKGVVEHVAKMSNWGNTPKGIFRGFSTWYSFGSYVAEVVDIELVNGKPRVVKVYCAVNCGRVINRSGAENQVQGAIVDGICHAMFPKVTFVNGAVEETNFHAYKFLRMKDAPLDIEVDFVDSDEAPAGLGEPALPPVAAALSNAIFAATGKRIRKMPFNEQLT
ncbi:xanthine dehydrogenase family protein molybdopterin-binding subunit [Echinicola salinicaeni]|uniref:xanthine dehydrogenase family protein molybdopterin-binding subunit n=1 Tax=Echinicola salinicaeni TaxID=2762757 RepID=UPI0016445FE0|nr:molybdopterin cofactor-binding domain-containing protein [Echinicola salinicaeni]